MASDELVRLLNTACGVSLQIGIRCIWRGIYPVFWPSW